MNYNVPRGETRVFARLEVHLSETPKRKIIFLSVRLVGGSEAAGDAGNIGPGIMIFTERGRDTGPKNVCRYFYLIIPIGY